MGHAARALSLVGILAVCPAGPGAEPIPAPRRVGGPGEEVLGQRLTLTAPTRLQFGQHLDVALFARQATTHPPYLRMEWKGPYRTVVVELTTDRGEVVPLVPELGSNGGTLDSTFAAARLRPTGPHSKGVYLAPGKYRLRAAIDARKDPFDPIAWVGRVEAEPVALTVDEADVAPLTPEAARKLVADLTAKDPDVRLAAVGRVPPTTNEDVLAALVGTLADPHQVEGLSISTHPVFVRPVADAARFNAIPAQGPAAIGPLLDFAGKPANALYRELVAEVLGKLGPDKRAFEFLRGLLDAGSHNERYHTVRALGRLGPEAVPELLRVARDGRQNAVIRRMAIEEMAHHGTAETVGPFLREALAYKEDQHQWAAARVIAAVEYRAALPDLKRLAEDERAEQNARADALRAFVALADRGDSRALLLKLLDSRSARARGEAAHLLGGFGTTDDVPQLIQALSDPDWYVRAQADHGLRGLADKPAGVGYDAGRNADAELWRAFWKNRR